MEDNVRSIDGRRPDAPGGEQSAYLKGLFDGAEREAANHDLHVTETTDMRRRATWVIAAITAVALLLAIALVLALVAIVILLGVAPPTGAAVALVHPGAAPAGP
ncbi:hypothetical protein [Georgenia thermotolerans]|uniref:DUF3040 domain-containing protein n=1 Tax=Georgenia thermotolerans TaxID=527326 RepID=A0A7J5UMP8_9MICO|nr:hypothetical protein [Georgenia thermotolerans]KAE8763213.1 hypothetical protein GB883_15290 [Georgenia thermotolerans]